ncbi:MAG: hypothetical protein IJS50_03440 [Desulfovibrio sp.]|nr:hypothetical protein [Desulfovibrio sp.]
MPPCLRFSLNWALLLLCFLFLCACQFGPRTPQVKEPSLVLLLPGSGSYAGLTSKILQGANAAKKELEAQGTMVRLAYIDSTKPDWLKKLAALPESFVTVGGPLEPSVYSQLMRSGVGLKRVCFAFMNNLNGNDEGKFAYRFFPSPQDQIDALVEFSTEALNIRSFGTFYGRDNYSAKMVGLFENTLKRRNLSLHKASYQSTDPQALKAQAKSLINPVSQGRLMVPQTAFEAVFLPAPFRQLDRLLGSFAANGEDRLVLLGPTSWEQSVQGHTIKAASRYELAVLPAAWDNRARTNGLKNADFWSALGYDFVNFAVNLGLVSKPNLPELVSRANRAAKALRILAPLTWDNHGLAHQRLILYRITGQGLTRMDVALFKRLRDARKEKAALRLQQGYSDDSYAMDPSSEEASSRVEQVGAVPSPTPAALPAKTDPSSMAPAPYSSHKLRLPKAKPAP